MTERRDGCFGLAAEAENGTVVGFSHCVLHPTTWSRGAACYLEDLYVDPDHRGTAAARALIEAAGEQGRAAGAETLYWHTQAFNGRARSLYDTRRAADLVCALRAPARVIESVISPVCAPNCSAEQTHASLGGLRRTPTTPR